MPHRLHVRLHLLVTVVAAIFIVPHARAVEQFVPMAPCRLVDTRVTPPATPAEESSRTLAIAGTRCGRFVPGVAVAYAIRVTHLDRASLAAPVVPLPAVTPLVRYPIGAPLVFPVASSEHIAVDLEGYYVPPGAALDPSTSTTAAASLKAAATGIGSLKPAPELHGTTGDLDVDVTDTFFNVTGFIGSAQAARPWVVLKPGASGGSGGFAVYNSTNTELFRITSDGLAKFAANSLSTLTDYADLSSAVRHDIVHNVVITNPTRGDTSTDRVIFFNAVSTDE